MTYKELYDKALWDLEHNRITLGEFDDMVEPLNKEIPKENNDNDLVSRKAVIDMMNKIFFDNDFAEFRIEYGSQGAMYYAINYVKELPSYSAEQTENPTKDICSAIEYWKSVDEDNNMVKWLTELQEYRKAEREKAEQTAEWMIKHKVTNSGSFWEIKCSNCGEEADSIYNYCPNCGAKMKGENQ